MSTRRNVRRARALAVFVLIATCAIAMSCVVGAPGASAASADGACAGASGVTVVVDATNAGGDISVRCALGLQASGWDALQHAGHDIVSVPQYPGTAVCKIDGRPADGYPTCWQTNFWSYFHAPNTAAGAAWKFSGSGAATYKPPAGSVDGWKYTSVGTQNDPPGRGPAFVTSAPTTQPPSAPPSVSATPPLNRQVAPAPVASAAPPASGAPATGGAAPTTTLAPGAVTAETPSDAGTTTSRPPSDARADATRRALDPVDVSNETSSGNGAPIGTVVGVALVIGVAGAAGAVAYRRRASRAADQ
jgi:hypothetical protein